MAKQDIIAQLRDESEQIHSAACSANTRLVWGEGNLDANLAIVGEAPGADEDRRGRPFVGEAGKLLERELGMAGIMRDDVYITNVVKCRPVRVEDGRLKNRTPTVGEVRAWNAMLIRELEVVHPSIILCLGAVAASTLIHPDFAMKAERGKWFDGPLNTRIMATYHPAYLLRTQAYGGREVLMNFRLDLNAVVSELKMYTQH